MGDSSPNFKEYGFPLYGGSWVPPKVIIRSNKDAGDEPQPSISAENYVIFAGGGGAGNTGIRNALLLSHYDFAANSLSDEPVAKLETGSDLPYRMAVHPEGKGVICSFAEGCRWLEWVAAENSDVHRLSLKSSNKVLNQLEDAGQQLALAFNDKGSLLAAGGEDGKLRVFKWPRMEIILDEENASSVKELHFSPDGKFLASFRRGGPIRVWDVASSSFIASLPKENDEILLDCRFSRTSGNNQVLYVTVARGQGGSIVKWNTTTWKRLSSKQIVRDSITALSVSADGNLLAIGTSEGDILILNSTSMGLRTKVRKAHRGIVTKLMFSPDSRALASASMDSSARVTQINDEKKSGFSLWIILLVILLAVAVYYAKSEGIIP